MEEDVRLALAVFFSIPIMFLLFPILSFIWEAIFPYYSAVAPYAGKFASPVHIALPIASAILFFLLFRWIEREKWFDPRSVLSPLGFILFVFLAYYVGIGGFYFFQYFNFRAMNVAFTYFLYVPYWTVLAGLISAWIFYVIPFPKSFKEKEVKSSR